MIIWALFIHKIHVFVNRWAQHIITLFDILLDDHMEEVAAISSAENEKVGKEWKLKGTKSWMARVWIAEESDDETLVSASLCLDGAYFSAL
jgi:hypothetical protein